MRCPKSQRISAVLECGCTCGDLRVSIVFQVKRSDMYAAEESLHLCDLGRLMEDESVPKVSTVHQGFAGTFTRMDGNDGEEKRGRETFIKIIK